jgi:fatty acid desaturase
MKRRKPVRAASEEEMRALYSRREDLVSEMMEDYRANCIARPPPPINSANKFNLEAFEKDTHELYQNFVKRGYFKPTLFWLVHKTALVLLLLSLSILSMKLLPTTESSLTPISYILPGIFLGLFWHQSGFLMHDAEHHNLVGNERFNEICGWIYGTVFLGVNGAWWREEHREHHALLNTFDDEGIKDPQVRQFMVVMLARLFACKFNHIVVCFIFICSDERRRMDSEQEAHTLLRRPDDSFSDEFSRCLVHSHHFHCRAYWHCH